MNATRAPGPKSSKRCQDLIKKAIILLHEARRVGRDIEPDTDIKVLYESAEEYLQGIIANLKAMETKPY